MDLIPPAALAPFGALALVAALVAGLFRALQSGALQTRSTVEQLTASWEARLDEAREATREAREIGAMWQDNWKGEHEARIRQEGAVEKLTVVSEMAVQTLTALRELAEEMNPR